MSKIVPSSRGLFDNIHFAFALNNRVYNTVYQRVHDSLVPLVHYMFTTIITLNCTHNKAVRRNRQRSVLVLWIEDCVTNSKLLMLVNQTWNLWLCRSNTVYCTQVWHLSNRYCLNCIRKQTRTWEDWGEGHTSSKVLYT